MSSTILDRTQFGNFLHTETGIQSVGRKFQSEAMNDFDNVSSREILEQFLKEQGHHRESIDRIMTKLDEYDSNGRIDGFFDSIADGSFDVESMFSEIIEESYEPMGKRILVSVDGEEDGNSLTGRIEKISAELARERDKYPLQIQDQVVFQTANAIAIGNPDDRIFAVPVDDVVVIHHVVRSLSELNFQT